MNNDSRRVLESGPRKVGTYAMPAVWRVEMNPQSIADMAIRAITLVRDGARAPSTPI